MTRQINRLITLLLAGTALTSPSSLYALELPTGGSVAHGTVGIGQPSATQLTIQQSSQTAIVNWQGFSIGQGGRVDISQPSSSATLLNRVTGATPSTIAGQLNANGQVYLINPNGIAITPTGIVRAGAFVGSSLDIADADFKAGQRVFRGNGHSATVSNAGTIDIGQGGYAALLGGRVENSGTISVPLGRVGLGAGEQATLDLSGDGFLQVAVPSRADGSTAALIQHSGRISAAGGRVIIQAATARDAARNAINLSGIVEARSVSGRSGAIVLGGGEGGTVTVSGRLDASARHSANARAVRPARGGDITVTGHAIALSGATLSANGTAGGGRIRIGGDYQGGGTLQRAATTRVDAATRISADAGTAGNGGSVVVWSDRMTDFAGRISARGGATGGNGGDAEVSGKALLAYTGMADLGAARGLIGTLLLDPYNVVISDGANANQTGFAATGNDSVINAATLSAALGTANVTVTTGGAGSSGVQAGDITVLSPLAWSAPTTLTLQAFRSIAVNADLSVNGAGGLVLTTNNGGTGGSLSFGNGARATYATAGGAGIPGQSLTIDGQAYQLLYSVADLQNMAGNLAGNYGLARSIDAGGTAFTPVGSTANAFTGRFNGLGQTIANLTVNTPAGDGSGLFGAATQASLANVNLTALNLTGGDNTGGLVGFATTTAVSGVTVAGRVAGADTTGGLLGGQVGGSVANAASTATVTGTDNTGGLVGSMDGGVITRSFATGQVSGGLQVGGLVGIAQSAGITQSYATGGVTGTDFVGGLVGALGGEGTSQTAGTVTSSFANGAVTSQGRGGGLVGLISNGGAIQDAYATGLTSGGTASGGLVGEINSVPAGGGGSTANATVATSYATGLVTGAGTSGGLIGNIVGVLQTITNSYWDTQTTGVATSAGTGATGLTTAQLQNTLPGGFTPGTWGTQADAYPYLTWRYPTGVLAVSGFTRGAADPGTPLAGEAVRVATGGTASYQANSGANGYYYVARDPLTGTAPQGASAFLDGANRGASVTDAPIGAGAITNLEPRVGRVFVTTTQPTASALATELANAGDSALSANIPYTVIATGGVPTFGSGLPTTIAAIGGSFTVDRSIVSAGALQIAGAVTPAGQASAGPLTIGVGQSVSSLNGDVVLATAQFVNNAGAAAVQAGGRVLIYSQDYAADQRGGLVAGNLYNRSFAANPPTTVTQAGSQFIYARQPILTVSAADATREYGPTALGFTRTVAGLVNGDTTAQAFTGVSAVADATLATTGVGTYAGAAQVTRGTLASSIGYAFAFANAPVTITPAPLTIRANDATKIYGTTLAFSGTEFTTTGLRNADQVASATLASAGAPATAQVAGSPYAITASNAQGAGLLSPGGASNYAITYAPGALTVTPAPLTIRANDTAKVYGTALAFTGTEFTATGLRNADQVTSATLASAGAPATAQVAGSPYAITASNAQGAGLLSPGGASNYAITFAPGALTVTPAPLTIRANDATKVFGTILAFAGTEFTATGLQNADQVTAATLASAGAPADASVAGSPYAITASTAQGTGLSNYAVAYRPGALTVSDAPVIPVVRVSALTIALTTPTLDRQFPTTFVPVSDPPDIIVAGGPIQTDLGSPLGVVGPGSGITSSGGPTLGGSRGVAIAAAATAGDATLDDLEAVGRDLDASVASCEQRDSRRVKIYNDCVATALEAYADKLDARIAQLPPALRNLPAAVRIPAVLTRGRAGTAPLRSVPDVIRAAARQVRASRTVAQARTIVRAAVTVIRKAISLIRADEPVVAARQVRHGNAIASAMESCDARLARAVGL
ncbi:filamentous hemagglutinin N-terminal domain-containing protein [Methylobacterium sp. BTF04]|uniref:beta strand repeat-containing protein n=1 Tax=Methylobacterium sp. BTF04 TaxID=2708300 RepID=UPI0013D1B9C9|nr:MBG domain-containing protein [Methylobacterium sp. BTF04]NEU11861.1 filamentous hemagglutinin N-terminal domain-containing protein [Methylobacterium sp. BTF04]